MRPACAPRGGAGTVTPVTEPLPDFPYHPDPVATGSVAAAERTCVCCGRARGYLYRGPVHAEADLAGRICPWCVADGSAARRYDAHFIGDPIGDEVPLEVLLRVDRHTPGYSAWQDPRWYFHCGDGAAFLGAVGAAELAAYPDALAFLRGEIASWGWAVADIARYLAALHRDGQPTAYLFRCRVCGAHLAHSDFT